MIFWLILRLSPTNSGASRNVGFKARVCSQPTMQLCWWVWVCLGITGTDLQVCAQEIPSDLEGVELYDWIGHHAISDRNVSNDTLNSVLYQGLQSDDLSIQSATLGALAWISVYKSLKLSVRDRFHVVRVIEEVPDLKETLILLWEQNIKNRPDPWVHISNVESEGEQVNVYVEVRNGRTVWKEQWAWLTIPAILVTFYPADPVVHEIVLEAGHPKEPMLTLCLLDVGQFTSKKANEFRIKNLLDKRASTQLQLKAALGLGRYQSSQGLAALVSIVQRTTLSETVVAAALESISTYTDAFKLYQEQINSVLERFDFVLPTDVELKPPPGEITTYVMYFVTTNQLEGEIEQLLKAPHQR